MQPSIRSFLSEISNSSDPEVHEEEYKKNFSKLTSLISEKENVEVNDEKVEERYKWLLDIKDKAGRSQTDPEYDEKTLYIPRDAWMKFTPFETQFWEIKSKHFDKIVFFKKGKFYELYEKDAEIASQLFDMKLVERVNMKMAGIPEATFDHWASKFVANGYKVARVDQVETRVESELRAKGGAKKGDTGIIKRDLTCILTAGTLVHNGSDMASYCISIKEISNFSGNSFGISMVDVSTAEFQICHIREDTSELLKLSTLLLQTQPKEILYEKGGMRPKTLKTIKMLVPGVLLTPLISGQEFWDVERTEKELRKYYPNQLPPIVESFRDFDVVYSSIGAMVSYLQSLKLDKTILEYNNYHLYRPFKKKESLGLDGQTLVNLEIFQNNHDRTDNYTLFKTINHCLTPFGKSV